jgi:hypothetical protein
MNEYFINPNPMNAAPEANIPHANKAAPVMTKMHHHPPHYVPRNMSADAVLVLFILLVIILQVCR